MLCAKQCFPHRFPSLLLTYGFPLLLQVSAKVRLLRKAHPTHLHPKLSLPSGPWRCLCADPLLIVCLLRPQLTLSKQKGGSHKLEGGNFENQCRKTEQKTNETQAGSWKKSIKLTNCSFRMIRRGKRSNHQTRNEGGTLYQPHGNTKEDKGTL